MWMAMVGLGVVMLAGPEPARATRPLGIDVSHYQGSITWPSVKASGIVFAWAKATEGTTFTDPYFTVNEANARAAGVYIGAYHYARYDVNTGTAGAIAEANYFWSVARNYLTGGGAYLVPALDVEADTTGYTVTTLSQWVNQWCHTVVTNAAAVGVSLKPIIYRGATLDSTVTQWYAWIPEWPFSPNPQTGAPNSIVPWSNWNVWQYADNTSVPGISGNVDGDVFNGTTAGLAATLVIGNTGNYLCTQSTSSSTSWNDSIWQLNGSGPDVAPSAGNTYEILSNGIPVGNGASSTVVRNPTVNGPTFPGASLTVSANAELRLKKASSSPSNPQVVTINNLTFDGGVVNGGNDGYTYNLQGSFSVPSALVISHGENGGGGGGHGAGSGIAVNLVGSLSGAGAIYIVNCDQTPQVVSGASNRFSGAWIVQCGYLQGTNTGSLGNGSISITVDRNYSLAGSPDPSIIQANVGATFEPQYDWTTSGMLILRNGGVIVLNHHWTFGAVMINGTALNAGTYSYTALANLGYGTNFTSGSGSLTVPGTSTTTALACTTGSSSQTYGSELTFTATVTGGGTTPGGNVVFQDGATPLATMPLSSGTAVYTSYTDLKVNGGSVHSIAAYYQGDGTHYASDSTASPILQIITPRALTVTAVANTKAYDGTTRAAATPTVTAGSVQSGDTAQFIETYDTSDVGTDKPLTPSGTVADGSGGANYTCSFVATKNGTILIAVSAPAYDSASGTFRVTFTGTPNHPYTVRWAPSPTGPWSFLTSATAGPDGSFEVNDSNLPAPPARYYRATSP